MYSTLNKKNRWGTDETFKKCVSIPEHEEGLIEDWKRNAKTDYLNESQYVRRLIREDTARRKTNTVEEMQPLRYSQ
tara:strand:+ start:160 stop:387 length:228 start_codon:yes stop_codon:yes gene_type:complete